MSEQARQADVYDAWVEYWTANPGEIYEGWGNAKPPFQFLARDNQGGTGCGCPSFIKFDPTRFGSQDAVGNLDEMIRAMPLVNMNEFGVYDEGPTVEEAIAALPAFAEAQRLADAMIPGRVKPEGPKQ